MRPVFSPNPELLGVAFPPHRDLLALSLVPRQEARHSKLQDPLLPWSWAKRAAGRGAYTCFPWLLAMTLGLLAAVTPFTPP